MANFDEAMKYIFVIEGDYVNDPHDPGGETKFGISKRTFPHIDIKNLTQENAKKVYKEHFWDTNNLGLIESQEVAEKVMSFVINMRFRQGVICLQRAVRAVIGTKLKEDGILGHKTLEVVNCCAPSILLAALKSEGAAYYRTNASTYMLEGLLNRAYG